MGALTELGRAPNLNSCDSELRGRRSDLRGTVLRTAINDCLSLRESKRLTSEDQVKDADDLDQGEDAGEDTRCLSA